MKVRHSSAQVICVTHSFILVMHGEHTRVVGISLILFISPHQFRLELLAWRNFIDSIRTAFSIDQLTCSH